MTEKVQVAMLGAGVIGASWAALFLAHGHRVALYDPAPDAEETTRRTIAEAWPTLAAIGGVTGDPDAIAYHADPAAAVAGARFIQESIPERLPLKHALFKEIEPALGPDAILSSSSSGLTLSEMQAGFADPSRLVLGHPFNPPHLIPLVEVMGNEKTAPGLVERTEAIYQSLGKVTIRVRREVPGHVANRLQAALFREAIHLVDSGVASVEDVDKAIWAGPGLRWAAMGPAMLFNLAAGAGGLETFFERFSDSFNRWWADLGTPEANAAVAAAMVAGVKEEAKGKSQAELAAERDRLIVAMLKATKDLRSRSN